MAHRQYVVESLFAQTHTLLAGTSLTAVFYTDARPIAAGCRIISEAPLVLVTPDSRVKDMEFPRQSILVHQEGDKFLKGVAEVIECITDAAGSQLEVRLVDWEDPERRMYPRIAAEVPVSLRCVRDDGVTTTVELYNGTTTDLSVGGAWVTLDDLPEAGSLLEFHAAVEPDQMVRAFGVVAHSSPARGGIGIEFLDYIGPSRYNLHSFLTKVA